MNKKLISLAPLLAIMAFAMVPAAAQAAGNGSPTAWKLGGKKSAVGTAVPVIAWGTLELVSAAGTIKCKNAAYSLNTNTAGGEARSEVVMFSTFECKASGGECTAPAEERATAFNLTPDAVPNKGVWSSENVEEGPAEAEETYRAFDLSEAPNEPIKVNIECYAAGEKVGSLLFVSGKTGLGPVGSSTPAIVNGTSATKPSETSFDAKSGHLFAEAEVQLEEVVEPEVKHTLGSPVLKDEPGGTKFNPIIKAGCSVKSPALFPNEIVKEVKAGSEELVLENKVNPGKNFGLATGNFKTTFKCGAPVKVPIEGTTKGKVKFVGYLDNAPTPLVTIGPKSALP